MYLLAYGSLRYGFELHHFLKNSRFVGIGFAEGYKMYDIGNYPGVIRGDGIIWGEVYEVDENLIKLLDEVEDFRGRPDDLYVRESTTVFFDQRRRFRLNNVYLYRYNQVIDDKNEIEDGDYSRWAGMPTIVNYFAYAENTNERVLKERGVKTIIKEIPAYLENYKMIFNIKCKYGYCANLKECPNCKVLGYIYIMHEDELNILDKAEEHLIRYVREIVKVKDNKNNEYYAQAYVSDYKEGEGKPSEEYLNSIKEGLKRKWGNEVSTGL
ncbi:gamma-glutamylcyclotransferase [Acidianus sulfidivorans JP7]|uniref:Gamma-glutamylcyclotransferase n=1 Tax=Acidianus sulfidivorans JP7 TaxID=619593 RepID=A0A2U9IKD2_9CREN|nr:gamma-glutamylcyclotransferase [Acidianus sulfidivorans]AWR96497.1 gamma-glutamylcyclotransferase [Acidianus sulfidivorans JP7]